MEELVLLDAGSGGAASQRLIKNCFAARFANPVLEQMDDAEIRPESLEEWIADLDTSDPVACGFPRCQKHHTLLSVFGCQIRNN